MADDDEDLKRNLREFRESVTHEFARVDERFATVDKRFEQVDKRFEQIDKRFEQIDKRFEQIDKRFEQVDKRFEQVDKRFEQVDKRMVDYQNETRERFRTMETAIMNALGDIGRTLVRIERRIDTHTHGPEAA